VALRQGAQITFLIVRQYITIQLYSTTVSKVSYLRLFLILSQKTLRRPRNACFLKPALPPTGILSSMASIAATQPSRHARRVHPRGALSHRCSCPRLPIYRIVQTGGSSSQLSSRALTTACRSSVCFPQLDAVPTAGFSDPFLSYFSAFRYNFGNGALTSVFLHISFRRFLVLVQAKKAKKVKKSQAKQGRSKF
jgi:hypothetical protein